MDPGKIALGIFLLIASGASAGNNTAAFQSAEAKAHYQNALDYENKGGWSAAILELNRARQLDPANPEVLTELGITHAERKEWKQALDFLREAVKVAPGSVRAHYNLALTLDQAQPGSGAGVTEYRRVLKIDPRHADALVNLGIDLGEQSPGEARKLFESAIQIAPNNAKAHLNLALLLNREGQQGASITEFREAIRLDADLAEARRQLAAILMAQQKWSEVVEQCRAILKREPDDGGTRYMLGQALMRDQQTEEGQKELKMAQEVRKRRQQMQEAEELQGEGVRELNAGKPADAVKALSRAVGLDSSSANHMYLGVALAATGDVKAGLRELETAVRLDPKNARAHVNLGSVYLQSGQEFLAKGEFERALEADAWLPEAHNDLGLMLAKNNDAEGAERHFRIAADLDPQYLEAAFNLGLALRALHRLDDALHVLRRAAEMAPKNPQVHEALGLTLKEKGDLAGAQAALDRAAALARAQE